MEPFSLHVEALAWLRFGKRMPFAATEVGRFNADALGADEKNLVEVEIKKSRTDFLNDFKKAKHQLYPSGTGLWVPNLFYFLVPSALGTSCLETLNERGHFAGLLVLESPLASVYGYGQRLHVRVARRATRLHERKPSPGIVKTMGLRMGSELTTLRLLLEQELKFPEVQAVVDCLRSTPDWETQIMGRYVPAERAVDDFYEQIRHGDKKHQQWLREKCTAWLPVLKKRMDEFHEENLGTGELE